MADMMSTLRTLLGDNADAKIQNAMNMLQNSGLLSQVQQNGNQVNNAPAQPANVPVNTPVNRPAPETAAANIVSQPEAGNPVQNSGTNNQSSSAQSILTPEGMQFIGQVRNMVEQMSNTNDSRSNLLRSLRPFMRTDRQRSIDRAIRIMNIGRFSGLFGR